MTDYNDFIDDRISGVRGMWELDFSNTVLDAVVDGVIFINNDIRMIVMPTHADDAIHLDIYSFVDGIQTRKDDLTVRRDT